VGTAPGRDRVPAGRPALAGDARQHPDALDNPAGTVLSLDGESHRAGDFSAVWCRLVEVASAAPTAELAAASAGQTEALA
jgi:hypothetical protein